MKFRFDPIALIYIFLVYIEVATERQKIFPVTYMSKYYIGILLILLFVTLLLANQGRIVFRQKVIYLSKILAIPIVMIFIYSLGVTYFNNISFDGYLSRLTGQALYGLLAIIQALFTFQYFGKRAVGYTFTAISLSYLTSIIVAYNEGGIQQFILMLTDSGFNGSVLEMHEVAPIVASFILYYLYQYFFQGVRLNYVMPRILIGVVILLLSMKRIVLLSIFLIIPVFLLILWHYGRQTRFGKEFRTLRFIQIITLVFLVIIFSYISAIRSGSIYTFIQNNNINSMSRTGLWKGIEPAYSFGLTFIGRGIGFVSKWMDNTWMNLNIIGLTETTGLHNDILKFYIELGFIGSFIYFYNYLYSNARRIFKTIGHRESMLYFMLMLFQMLNWFTDNISIYHNFQWVFYLLLFSLIDSDFNNVNPENVLA